MRLVAALALVCCFPLSAYAQLDFTTRTDTRLQPRRSVDNAERDAEPFLGEHWQSQWHTPGSAGGLLFGGTPTQSPFAPQTPHPAVVRVIAAEMGGASLGSGTLVDVNGEHGLVVTNWHVVRDAPQGVIVLFPDGFQSLGQVLRMDRDWDLAAILIKKPPASPVRLANAPPQIGEMLTIAGYGSGAYRAQTGRCTQYLAPSTTHPYELVELNAAARQGDSGGPIFNSRGELAGVLFGQGGGRTTGAYCGRVHHFLTLASAHLRTKDTLASTGNAAGQMASASFAHSAASGESSQAKPAAEASGVSSLPPVAAQAAPSDAGYWTPATPLAAIRPPDRVSFEPPKNGGSTVASLHTASPAGRGGSSGVTAPWGTASPSSSKASPAGPAHANPASTQWQQRGSAVPPVPGTSNTASDPIAAKPVTFLDEFLAGDTLAAQLKTVLAGCGLLAFLYHSGRAIARSANSKKTKSR